MNLLAIDPGTTQSAFVRFVDGAPVEKGIVSNYQMLDVIWGKGHNHDTLAIEMVASYGKPVGEEVFETCLWIGRFIQQFPITETSCVKPIKRHEVKMELCHSISKVTDAVIRQRIIDIYGGKEKAIGNKKSPGPLYGLKGDEWQALAVGMTWLRRSNPGSAGEVRV